MENEKIKRNKKVALKGLSNEQKAKLLAELKDTGRHDLPEDTGAGYSKAFPPKPQSVYSFYDLTILQKMGPPVVPYTTCLASIDELLERDRQREADGFPRKIQVGRLIKPGQSGKDKVVVVPSTVEEKFIHDSLFRPHNGEGTSGGSGDGDDPLRSGYGRCDTFHNGAKPGHRNRTALHDISKREEALVTARKDAKSRMLLYTKDRRRYRADPNPLLLERR